MVHLHRLCRNILAVCLLLLMLGLASGCGAVATREPIYDPAREGIFDQRLIGKWSWTGGWGFPEGEIEFVRGPGKSYFIKDVTPRQESETQSESDTVKSEPVPMDLIRLGKYRYLFFRSKDPEIGTVLFPSYRVEFMFHGQELRLRLLNTIAIGRFLQEHRDALKFEESEPWSGFLHPTTSESQTRPAETRPTPTNLILTDTPAKIRRFLIRHQDDRNWVFEPWVLHRGDPEVSY